MLKRTLIVAAVMAVAGGALADTGATRAQTPARDQAEAATSIWTAADGGNPALIPGSEYRSAGTSVMGAWAASTSIWTAADGGNPALIPGSEFRGAGTSVMGAGTGPAQPTASFPIHPVFRGNAD